MVWPWIPDVVFVNFIMNCLKVLAYLNPVIVSLNFSQLYLIMDTLLYSDRCSVMLNQNCYGLRLGPHVGCTE